MKRSLIACALAAASALLASVAVASAGAPTATPTPTPSPTATPSPTFTPTPLGSISGRVYIDVNANGMYDGPDVAGAGELVFGVFSLGPSYSLSNISADGSYQLTGLQPGSYTLELSVPGFVCAPMAPFNWVGGEQGDSCGLNPTTRERTVDLGPGEDITGIDFPQVPATGISGRLWLNGAPMPAGTEAFVTVSGRECWQVATASEVTAAGITIASFTADLEAVGEGNCIQGDIALIADGNLIGESVSWSQFWSGYRLGRTDFMAPPFMGLSGRVIIQEGATELDSDSLVADDTLVTAIVGSTVCGQATTKTLENEFGGKMNLFGLIVPPRGLQPGCGIEGAPVAICVGASEGRIAGILQPPPVEVDPFTWVPGKTVAVTIELTDERCPVALGLPPTGFQVPERAAGPAPLLRLVVGGAMVLAGATLLTLRRAVA